MWVLSPTNVNFFFWSPFLYLSQKIKCFIRIINLTSSSSPLFVPDKTYFNVKDVKSSLFHLFLINIHFARKSDYESTKELKKIRHPWRQIKFTLSFLCLVIIKLRLSAWSSNKFCRILLNFLLIVSHWRDAWGPAFVPFHIITLNSLPWAQMKGTPRADVFLHYLTWSFHMRPNEQAKKRTPPVIYLITSSTPLLENFLSWKTLL